MQSLVEKDFKVRYRNMSLGVFWSLLNPLVMMGVLWIIFTKIMVNPTPHFATFLLCGLVPFNFFTLGWITSTTSLVDSAPLIKRLTAPPELFPIAVVLGNSVHFVIQVGLLILISLSSGLRPNVHWLWLPYIWFCEIVFISGLGLMFSVLNVYVRDTRYFVESCNLILFWFVPIVYSFSIIPAQYVEIYRLNPLAALVFATRNIVLEGISPAGSLLRNLTLGSVLIFIAGALVFRQLSKNLYDYL